MKSSSNEEASPYKSVAEELLSLRKILRETVNGFSSRLETEIVGMRETVLAEGGKKRKAPSTQVKDLRDMLTLIRMLEVKPEKGRRRDLKKLESVVEDLRRLVDDW